MGDVGDDRNRPLQRVPCGGSGLRVGFDTAAKPLVAAGDNPERIRTEAAWAYLRGVAPIPASSGRIIRHRLNRDGNRQANSVFYHIVLTRMHHDQTTRDYMARRLGGGRPWARSPASSNATPTGKSSNTSHGLTELHRSGSGPIEPTRRYVRLVTRLCQYPCPALMNQVRCRHD